MKKRKVRFLNLPNEMGYYWKLDCVIHDWVIAEVDEMLTTYQVIGRDDVYGVIDEDNAWVKINGPKLNIDKYFGINRYKSLHKNLQDKFEYGINGVINKM